MECAQHPNHCCRACSDCKQAPDPAFGHFFSFDLVFVASCLCFFFKKKRNMSNPILTGENLRLAHETIIDSSNPQQPTKVWGVNFHYFGSNTDGEEILPGQLLNADWIEWGGRGRVYARGWGTLSSTFHGLPRTGPILRDDANVQWHPALGSWPFSWPVGHFVLL